MKIRYDAEADVLYVVLREDPPVDAVEEPGGVIVSYGEDGGACGGGASSSIRAQADRAGAGQRDSSD